MLGKTVSRSDPQQLSLVHVELKAVGRHPVPLYASMLELGLRVMGQRFWPCLVGSRISVTEPVFDPVFRSTSKSRPNNIRGGKMSVRTSVRPSTKSFFDFNEIWYIGRGR